MADRKHPVRHLFLCIAEGSAYIPKSAATFFSISRMGS